MRIIAPVVSKFESICSSMPWIVKRYMSFYDKVLDREIALAGISQADTVLNIGCGSIPFSAIYIAEKTGACVYAVDIDQKAAACAERCIAKLVMSGQVFCSHEAGQTVPCHGITVALTALQASPKRAILEHLMHYTQPGTRILFRRPQPRLIHQYDALPEDIPVEDEIKQYMSTFISSVMYLRSA